MTVKNKIAAAGVLMIFGYGLVNNTLGFFVTPVSQALGCSRASFNLYYTISCVVSLFASPFFGRMLQRTNARRLILAGMAVGGAAFFSFALCTRIEMFYGAAFLLGLVQQGATSVTAMVLVTRAFKESAGAATGFVMSGTGICSVSMSFVLPALIERAGWKAGYLLEAALWLLVMGAAWLLTAGTVEYPQDLPKEREASGKEGPEGAGGETPSVSRGLLLLLGICFAVQGVGTIVVQHVPSFLTEVGMTTAESSLLMGVFSLMLIFGKLLLGFIFDHMGEVKALVINFLSFGAGMWLMARGNTASVWAGAVLLSFGMASITVLFPLIAGFVFGQREYAPVWGMLSMAISCGTALGSPMWGAVYDHFGSYRPAFLAMPFVVIVNCLVLAWAMTHCGTKEGQLCRNVS